MSPVFRVSSNGAFTYLLRRLLAFQNGAVKTTLLEGCISTQFQTIFLSNLHHDPSQVPIKEFLVWFLSPHFPKSCSLEQDSIWGLVRTEMAESYVCPDYEGDRKTRHTCVREMMTTSPTVQAPLLHTRLPKHILVKEVGTFWKGEGKIRSKKGILGQRKWGMWVSLASQIRAGFAATS